MVHLLLAVIYLAFIGLGLPDPLLGSAWPSMYPEFTVSISSMGILSTLIATGTVTSSILSDRLTKNFGSGKITAASVGLTAIALFGFSVSHSFWLLCIFALPYGLGAGSVDAALNNYVALHYKSSHMSWLHCMWGVGASLGPHLMGYALTSGNGWNTGYRYVALIQIALTVILFLSLPLWKKRGGEEDAPPEKALTMRKVIGIPGAKDVFAAFFFYCALESATGHWGGSFLVLEKGLSPEEAASVSALFFLGITAGRAVSGFLSMAVSDANMTRLGEGVILVGVSAVLLSESGILVKIGLILIGLGCAPIYPSIIHSTPQHFGSDKSQAIIGMQMASAYVGIMLMPPLFGLIAQHLSIALFPLFLLLLLIGITLSHEGLLKKTRTR